MVLIVQSDHQPWTSPMSCDAAPVVWNLRRPLGAALAATAELLGGVVPLHTAYDAHQARGRQNWLWSVGPSPLAYASSAAGK